MNSDTGSCFIKCKTLKYPEIKKAYARICELDEQTDQFHIDLFKKLNLTRFGNDMLEQANEGEGETCDDRFGDGYYQIAVITVGHKIQGIAIYMHDKDNKILTVHDVVVDSNQRGMGLGKVLLNYVLNHIKRPCDHAELLVMSNNTNAYHLYRSLGFVTFAYNMVLQSDEPTMINRKPTHHTHHKPTFGVSF